jgi:GT2 family glycosyltransferase
LMSKAAVLILNYNKVKDLIECLESVFKLDFAGFEVVVIDNGSSDGSGDAAAEKFPSAHVLKLEKNLGSSGGRNAGIEYIKNNLTYEYVLFLDNDTVVEPDFLTRLMECFSKFDNNNGYNVGITCGKTYTNSSSKIIMSVGMVINLYFGMMYDRGSGKLDNEEFNKSCEVDACGAFGFLIKKDVLLSVEKFDERYYPYGWEDVDFCFRVREKGYKIVYVPDAVMYHKGTKLGRKPKPQYERSKIKNFFLFLRIHANFIQKSVLLFVLPFRALFLFVNLIMHGNSNVISHQFMGLADALLKRKSSILLKGKNNE